MNCSRGTYSGEHAIIATTDRRIHTLFPNLLKDAFLESMTVECVCETLASWVVLRLQLGFMNRLLVRVNSLKTVLGHMIGLFRQLCLLVLLYWWELQLRVNNMNVCLG